MFRQNELNISIERVADALGLRPGQTKDMYAQTNGTQKTEEKPDQEEQHVGSAQADEKQEVYTAACV